MFGIEYRHPLVSDRFNLPLEVEYAVVLHSESGLCAVGGRNSRVEPAVVSHSKFGLGSRQNSGQGYVYGLLKDRADVPAALELEETGGARQRHTTIPQVERGLTVRRR